MVTRILHNSEELRAFLEGPNSSEAIDLQKKIRAGMSFRRGAIIVPLRKII